MSNVRQNSTVKKVLCLVPPTGKFVREDRCQTPIKKLKTISLRPPIDLMYAAGGFVNAGCEVQLIDFAAKELDWVDVKHAVANFSPDLILISTTTLSLKEDLSTAEFVKRLIPTVSVGAIGAYFNTLDLSTLESYPSLDFVLRGEYEEACIELGQGKHYRDILGCTWRDELGELQQNGMRPFANDLDSLPWPARHLIDNTLYLRPDTEEVQTTIVTNRGCPYSCIYCLANQVAGIKNRYRSVGNVIEEIRYCVEELEIKSFLFRSELFTQNERWVKDLCEALIASNLKISWACNSRVDSVTLPILQLMKKAGCWIVAYGVESGDQETLNKIQKKAKVEDAYKAVRLTRQAGIRSSVYLMIGLPWDTIELIEKQAQFAVELDPDFLEVFYPYPFPGTPIHKMALELKLLEGDDLPKVAYAEPALPTKHLSIEELKDLRRKILRKFYLRPRMVARTLKNSGGPREFFNYVKAGANQLSDLFAES